MKRIAQALARPIGHNRVYILSAALALLSAACTNDEYPTHEPQGDRVAIELTAPISPPARGEYGEAGRGASTRANSSPFKGEVPATRAEGSTWHAQDAIGLFTLDPETSAVVDGQANYRYLNQSAAGATATFSPADAQNTAYFPVDGSKVSVLAYYPYNANVTPGSGTLPVPVDVADQTHLPAIDLMTSAAVQADKSNPAVQLSFEHRLTKLSITLQADASFPSGTDLSTATLTLTGTPATAQYDLVAQSLTPSATAQDIALPLSPASGGTATSQAIVIPTAAGKGVAFKIAVNGDEYTGKLPGDVALKAGEEVTVTITLKKSKAEIEASIRPWGTGSSTGLEAVNFTMPVDPKTGEPAVTSFTLYKVDANGAETPAEYSYNITSKEWTAQPGFFYVEDIEPTDKFYALHTPAKGNDITGVKDILRTPLVTLGETRENVLDLAFEHVNARLTVNLYTGNESQGIDISDATVEILGYNFTGVANTLVVEPQKIEAGKEVVVNADGKTFTATVGDLIDITGGNAHTVNILLAVRQDGKTSAGLEVTIKTWGTGGTDELTAINYYQPVDPTTGKPAVEKFTLYRYRDGSATLGVEYTYDAAQKSWTAIPEAFYAEDVLDSDLFQAVHTPEKSDPVTGLADKMSTPKVGMDKTSKIIDLAFAHENAQLHILLYRGEGVDESVDLSTAETSLLGHTFKGGDVKAIIAPREIAAGEAIKVTAGSREFNCTAGKMSLTAGNTYTLRITLKSEQNGNTVAGLEVTKADWTPGGSEPLTAIHFTVPKNPETQEPAVKTFALTKSNPSGDPQTVTYTWTGTEWNTGKDTPFYAEFISTSDRFTAEYIPAKGDDITGVKDILRTAAVAMDPSTWVIPLKFEHVNAQVQFVLERGAGFTDPLDGAQINVSLGDKALTLAADAEYLIEPENTSNKDVSVKLTDNRVYSGTLSSFTAVGGQKTVVKVTLKTTEAASISVEAAAWGEEINKETDVKLPINIGNSDLSKLPGTGTIEIVTGAHTGRYTWNGTSLTTGTPIYWDNLPSSTTHNFTFTFTPDAAGTPEKDILVGSATGVNWGGDIAFGALEHKHARFSIALKKGTGYSDTEWGAITPTLTLNGFTTNAYVVTGGVAILSETTLGTAHTLVLSLNGYTYTINLKDKFTTFEGGKKYGLTATVNKTGIGGISIEEVADWLPGDNVSGTFE